MKYVEVRGSIFLLNTGTAKYTKYISTYIKYVSHRTIYVYARETNRLF
jgi:hypothetical protein